MTVRLWRDEPDGESDESILREQLDAMSAFAQGWLEPLAVAIDVTCLEHGEHSDPRPDAPSWLIRTSGLPALRMEPVVAGSRVEDLPLIGEGDIDSYVQRALSQECAGGSTTGLERLEWTALRVRLPVADPTEFVLESGGAIEMPIERRHDGDWVSGPRASPWTEPPFLFHVGEAELRLDVIWDFWAGGPGAQQVEAAVGRVLARGKGWYRAP